MELNFSKREKLAGTFVIFVAVLLLITVIAIGRGKDWFKTYVTYYTTFNESYNLKENAAVKLYRTDIGKVKKITLIGDKVKVELNILEEYTPRIRMDSVAIVESPTFIGSEYVSVTPGKTTSALIPKGGAISSKAKKSVSDLLTEFEIEKTAKMVVKAAQDLSELVQLMREPTGPLFSILDNLNRTTAHIEGVTGDIQAGKGTVGALLKSDAILKNVREILATVGSILDHIATASATMPAKMDQVGSILDNIDQASSKAPRTMDMVQDNLATIKTAGEGVVEGITHIKTILKQVETNLGALKVVLANMEKASFDIPEITRSVVQGIKETRESIASINKVVLSLQKNILIRSNLPPEPVGKNTDARLRQ